MNRRLTTALAAALLFLAPAVSQAALTAYHQDFESLVQSSPTALSGDGWLVYGNVFSPDHSTWYYGYGAVAPNNTGAFSGIDFVAPPSPPQGLQDLVVYSDYNNPDHANGFQIESNVYQQQTIDAVDVGSNWTFQFDAKLGNLESPSTALAFIKTLDPNNGYAMTHFVTVDMTTIPSEWNTYSISLPIDNALAGQILQFGFANTTTSYKSSGVFYDNVSFRKDSGTPAVPTSWGNMKARYH